MPNGFSRPLRTGNGGSCNCNHFCPRCAFTKGGAEPRGLIERVEVDKIKHRLALTHELPLLTA